MRRKSYLPSSGSIQSHETPVITVFMWTLLASRGHTTFMRSASEETVLLSSPASTRNGLPSTTNCVAWPRFSKCGVCARAARATAQTSNALPKDLRLVISTLRDDHGTVPQRLAHLANVHPGFEQFHAEGVPEHVRSALYPGRLEHLPVH